MVPSVVSTDIIVQHVSSAGVVGHYKSMFRFSHVIVQINSIIIEATCAYNDLFQPNLSKHMWVY